MRKAGLGLFFCLLTVSLQAPAQSPDTPGWRVTEAAPQTQTAPDPGYSKDALSTSITGARAILASGDLLDISVFDTPELTQRGTGERRRENHPCPGGRNLRKRSDCG